MRPHDRNRPHPRTAPTGNGWSGFYTYRGAQPEKPRKAA